MRRLSCTGVPFVSADGQRLGDLHKKSTLCCASLVVLWPMVSIGRVCLNGVLV